MPGDPGCCGRNGRCRIARLGLEEKGGFDIGLGEGVLDQEAVLAVGDHDRCLEERIVGDAG